MQRQGQLRPAFVDEALDPSDPVLFIDEVLEGRDLTALEQRDARWASTRTIRGCG